MANYSPEQMLQALQKASNKIETLEKAQSEPIAIIGMGCRFPGKANNSGDFWTLLQERIDPIQPIPKQRWENNQYYDSDPEASGKIYIKEGYFIDKVDQFDPLFFGISPREAESIDPQQRLLLEVSWEALENAGTSASGLKETQTGVFIGIGQNDYANKKLNSGNLENINAYDGIGNGFCFASGRLSYFLGVQGPNLAVDTACSSSLVSVHLACQSLRMKECDLALAGGVQLILSPELTMFLCRTQALSPSGRCKTFDASADGYGRGEGGGMVVLKRLSDALADQDNILAVIKGSVVNHDGPSSGLTVPNGMAQQALIRQALKKAKIKPSQVNYIEAHGTGTIIGDPIEVNALAAIFEEEKTAQQPLVIGSVKSNIGHLEAAAGVASLIKVVLCLQHQKIPANLNFEHPNPYIDWEHIPIEVASRSLPWPRNEQKRYAGISSFGLSGTNAHIILEEAPTITYKKAKIDRHIHLLTLSAKNEPALRALVSEYQDWSTLLQLPISDICYTANVGRVHFEERLTIISESSEQLQQELQQYLQGNSSPNLIQGKTNLLTQKIAFLFTGQGSQYANMGKELYQTQPTFKQALEQCAEILDNYLDKALLEILYLENPEESHINQTAYAQPSIFALEYALYQLWTSWGIKPDIVMGHSIGEYVAACVAGVFSLEDALKLVAYRGKLIQSLPQDGEMVSLLTDETTARQAIEAYQKDVSLAAINGQQSIVISGKRESIEQIITHLTEQGIKTKKLTVSHAFHSPLMQSILEDFREIAQSVTYQTPQIPLISNVTGKIAAEEVTTSEYWVEHIRKPVNFLGGMTAVLEQEADIFLEIGAKPILVGMGKMIQESQEERKPQNCSWLPSLRPEQSNWQQILSSLSQMYVRGVKIDWQGFDKDYVRQKVQLPTYPFQRQRYWVEEKQLSETENLLPGIPETTVTKLINQGNVTKLIQQLELINDLSADETALLPKLVKLLVTQHTKEVGLESFKDWLYQIEWMPKVRQGKQLPPDYFPEITAISSSINNQLSQLINKAQLDNYKEAIDQLEDLSVAYILAAFKKLGWQFDINSIFSTTDIFQQLGIVETYQRLLERLLEILEEEKLIQKIDQQKWQVIRVPERLNPSNLTQDLLQKYDFITTELTLLDRCGSHLSQVLRGECDVLELLFPQNGQITAAKLYQDSLATQALNRLFPKIIASAITNLPPGRPLKILEIGAGTGGTTFHVVHSLPPEQTEYVFTDIGSSFILQAKKKFEQYPFIKYQTLDVEQNPDQQGFKDQQYDIIIASNVLHATRDLRQTLRHVRQLLSPQGMLLLLEATERQRLLDLVFGLTEGWWRFTDVELRPSYTLLSIDQWKALLLETGFKSVVSFPEPNDNNKSLSSQQAVIAAQASSEILRDIYPSEEQGIWLILADKKGIGQQLKLLLEAKGEEVMIVFAGLTYKQQSENEFTLNAQNSDEFSRVIEIIKNRASTCRGIVHLWSIDAAVAEDLTNEHLMTASQLGCGSTLKLIQTLLKINLFQIPSLWLVTQGAQPVGNEPEISGIAQSPLWGMGKVISLEHPELNCVRVDLDSHLSGNEAKWLFEEIWASDGEDEVALHRSGRKVARLVRSSHLEGTSLKKLQQLNDNSTYLITGGLNELGLTLAQWMTQQGAKYIVLVEPNEVQPSDKKQVEQLEQAGVQIVVVQADISKYEQIAQVLADIDRQLPPLKGIIHAANIPKDRLITDQEWEEFQEIFAPKATGTWNLHTLTQNIKLDFFVLFSSVSTLLPVSGHSNNAAANIFMDMVAYYRKARGLPGLSIDWEIELTGQEKPRNQEFFDSLGINLISPTQGLKILELLLVNSFPQVGVLSVNWDQLVKSHIFANYSLLKGLIKKNVEFQDQASPSSKTASFSSQEILTELKQAASEDRPIILIGYLKALIGQTLNIASSQLDNECPLSTMGVDSLMAMEMRNRVKTELDIDIPVVQFLASQSIREISDYLEEVLVSDSVESSQNNQLNLANATETEILENLEQLSDSEIDNLLKQMLSESEA